MSIDLAVPIRTALLAAPAVLAVLPAYKGSRTVFTRVPVPADAPYPLIVAHEQMGGGEDDGVNDVRPVIVRDVTVYGRNDTPEHFREVGALAETVWELFHRQRGSLTVPGWEVTDVRAALPRPAPVDDEETAARRVELTVRLSQ